MLESNLDACSLNALIVGHRPSSTESTDLMHARPLYFVRLLYGRKTMKTSVRERPSGHESHFEAVWPKTAGDADEGKSRRSLGWRIEVARAAVRPQWIVGGNAVEELGEGDGTFTTTFSSRCLEPTEAINRRATSLKSRVHA